MRGPAWRSPAALALSITLILAGVRSARAQTGAPAGDLPALRTGNVLLYYWPGGERLARRTIEPPGVFAPLTGLPADVLEGPPAIRIYLAPDAARFDSLTGGRSPDWGAGVAFPDSGMIVLPGYASERVLTGDLPRVLRHELAHVALQRYLGPARVPRWFTEGYSTWAAGQLDTDAAWLLRIAFLMQRAPPLDSLALEWPRGEADARIAYLLSASAVEYLVENGGERGLTLFLERWRESGDFEGALRATYGLTFGQLERYWSRAVRRRYGWVLFLAQSAVLWAVVAAIVVTLYLIRRRRSRARLERLRAAEIPDRPAYWLGEDAAPAEESGAERGDERPPPV